MDGQSRRVANASNYDIRFSDSVHNELDTSKQSAERGKQLEIRSENIRRFKKDFP